MIRGYRIWDNQEKTYSDKAFSIDQLGICYVQDEDGYWEEINDSRFIVEFETGLTDKNGKEIYEGDIMYDIYTGDEVFIVGWDKDKASFMLADTADYPMAYFDEYKLDKDLEVIGNVHENPELLGGKE